MNKLIRLSKSVVSQEEKDAVCRVLEDGFLGMGQEVQLFEQEIQTFLQTEADVVCVNTGTAALQLALQGLGIGAGDEVLVPSITYVASFQAITATGATAIACDVREENALIDLEDAASRVSPRTKAIMPVHYASNTAGMKEVYQFARERNLRIVEDAAHSFGCSENGSKVGSTGDIVCFSFDGIKNITSGEGGAIVTSDADVSRRIKDARLLGVVKDTEKRFTNQRSWEFDVVEQGWRYHMSNLMAAIGREQLKKIEAFSQARSLLAKNYVSLLSGISQIQMLDIDYDNTIPHIFPVRVVHFERSHLRDGLAKINVQTGVHYQPCHYLQMFGGNEKLPVAERLGAELLSLPLHPDLTFEDQELIVEEIKKIISRPRR